MLFKTELYKILDSIYEDDFSYSYLRIPHITVWGEHLREFMELFYHLEDSHSKQLFIQLLKYNLSAAMTGNQSKYSLYTDDEWNLFKEKANKLHYIKDDYLLDRIETFILEGYNYNNICCAKKGNYVIDCGAYTGNTSIYFSDKVGREGKVFSFEAMPSTYDKLKKNIAESKRNNINVYNYAVSDRCKTLLFTEDATPSSRQVTSGHGVEIKAASIDAFVRENNIKHIDFIKMDVEGAELDVLNGCEETCKKFSPILAVCLYHKKDDFITLPARILQINPNYRFYLKHNSNRFIETVLFAIAQDTPLKISVQEEELTEVQYLWNAFQKIHVSKQKIIQKHLLTSYIAQLKKITHVNLHEKIDTKNFLYAYFPLSKDEKIHYEFLFRGNAAYISLHFEKHWTNQTAILNEIADSCKLSQIKLQCISSSSREECCFAVPNVYDIQYIAELMNYLISTSFPILKTHGLISDQIILENI